MKYIFANWKMNPPFRDSAKQLVNDLAFKIKYLSDLRNLKIVLLPPFVWLDSLSKLKKSYQFFSLGAQNVFWENSGAFTGEISLDMLKDLGVEYVLVGHSEREIYLSETQEMSRKKLEAVLRGKLTPVLCLHPKNINQLDGLLDFFLAGLGEKKEEIIYLYEPTEAISTQQGKAPSQETINLFYDMVQTKIGKKVPVLYGGSLNEQNAADLLLGTKIDGGLVGAKCLDANAFFEIIKQLIQ